MSVPATRSTAFAAARNAVERVAGTLIELNAREAQRAARDVVATHEQAKAHSTDFLLAVLACVLLVAVLAERWIARSERETARLLAELDAFSARVAHDLRGPLSPVSLGLGLVKADPGLGDRARHTVEVAERSLRRALALIDGLLVFARSGARPEPGARVEVARVLDEVALSLQPLAQEERAQLTLDVPAGLAVAVTDVALSSIVSNLARNALLYLGDGEKRTVAIRATLAGESVRIEVADTGLGIPAAQLERIFRPFERASDREGGHGLGLAIVKRLTEAHGGSIAVRSQLGLGSTFTVELPRA